MPAAQKPSWEALPTLRGEGVIVRPLDRGDLPALYAIFSDPEVVRFMSMRLLTSQEDAARLLGDLQRYFDEGSLYSWGIALDGDPSVIAGTCTLASIDRHNQRAELGFALAPAMRGKGLIARAARLVLDVAFTTLGLRRVEADTDPRNAASIKVLERLGFVREGLSRERYVQLGEVQDAVMFGLLERDWEALEGSRARS